MTTNSLEADDRCQIGIKWPFISILQKTDRAIAWLLCDGFLLPDVNHFAWGHMENNPLVKLEIIMTHRKFIEMLSMNASIRHGV